MAVLLVTRTVILPEAPAVSLELPSLKRSDSHHDMRNLNILKNVKIVSEGKKKYP